MQYKLSKTLKIRIVNMKRGKIIMRNPVVSIGEHNQSIKKMVASLLMACSVALFSTGCELNKSDNKDNSSLLMMISALLGSPTAADTTAPTVTAFALSSPAVTARGSIRFNLDATDDTGVTAYLVGESAEKPAPDDSAWSEEKPAAFSLSAGYADKTVYAYAKDAAGNVSDGVSLSVRYVQPGAEDADSWDKKFDWNNDIDMTTSVAVDANGSVYVTGRGTNLVSETSNSDWWIKKFDANGTEDTVNWDKKFDGNNDYDITTSIAIDANGNVYVAGAGMNLVSATSNSDWWIKKFDSNGVEDTVNWDKKIDNSNGEDMVYSIAVDGSGTVYAAGRGICLVSETSGADWWIKKFDANGVEDTVSWNKKIDCGGTRMERAFGIAVDANGNVYVAGSEDFNARIKKFDASGAEDTVHWDKRPGGVDSMRINSIAVDSNGSVYAAGNGENLVDAASNADWWIKKFDSNGVEDTVDWDKKIDNNNGMDMAHSITVDVDGIVYVAGNGENLVNATSGPDWWIKKFDTNGVEDAVNWNKEFDGTGGSDAVLAIAVDINCIVYVAGYGQELVGGTSSADWWIKKFFGE